MRPFQFLLRDPALWALRRRSVVPAFALGLFLSMIPAPGQTAMASLGALSLRVNLPVAVLATWFNNPITMYPLFYIAYRTGATLLGMPQEPFNFEPSLEWLSSGLAHTWLPLVVGCLIIGTTAAGVGFAAMSLLWRLALIHRFRNRRKSPSRAGHHPPA